MKITDAFPSNYIKSSDLNGRVLQLTIDRVTMEDLDGEQKPVLYFQGKQKGTVLNRTNATTLVAKYGDETEAWQGKPVELFTAPVSFQGLTVDGLRVRIPAPASAEYDDIPGF